MNDSASPEEESTGDGTAPPPAPRGPQEAADASAAAPPETDVPDGPRSDEDTPRTPSPDGDRRIWRDV